MRSWSCCSGRPPNWTSGRHRRYCWSDMAREPATWSCLRARNDSPGAASAAPAHEARDLRASSYRCGPACRECLGGGCASLPPLSAAGRARRPEAPAPDDALAGAGDRAGLDPGRPARAGAGTVRALARQLRLATLRDHAERAGSAPRRTRWARHPFPARPLARARRAADDHDAWLARFGDRVPPGDRAAGRSGGARRRARRRLPPRAALAARLRLLGQAGGERVDRRPHRRCLDHADAPPRLRTLGRPGRRLGCGRHRRDRQRRTRRLCRGASEHGRHRAPPRGRGRSEPGGAQGHRADQALRRAGERLRQAAGHAAANPGLRTDGLPPSDRRRGSTRNTGPGPTPRCSPSRCSASTPCSTTSCSTG